MSGGPELLKLVEMIHQEKDIDPETLFVSIEMALETAVRKRYEEAETLDIRIDRGTGDITAYKDGRPINAADLGRIAAQTAKQVIIQKIREAEQDVVYGEFETRKRELATGTIQRFERDDIVVSLGRGEGVLPRTERVRGENPRVGDRIRALVLDVKRVGNRVRIIMSRTHPDLIRRLFELEVPEISEGIIEIKHLAREPGYRTKIAVTSYDPKIDCVGACVGVRGSRIRNIIDELNGEKIDIIRWNDSPEVLIMNALKPAEIESITLNDETGECEVLVGEDQLSLAIGKKGQNVRLAAKLTGWAINIVGSGEAMTDPDAEGADPLGELISDGAGDAETGDAEGDGAEAVLAADGAAPTEDQDVVVKEVADEGAPEASEAPSAETATPMADEIPGGASRTEVIATQVVDAAREQLPISTGETVVEPVPALADDEDASSGADEIDQTDDEAKESPSV